VGEKGQHMTIHQKVYAHVILIQMSIRDGLLAFGKKEMRQFKGIESIA